jgi:hypothetical protein
MEEEGKRSVWQRFREEFQKQLVSNLIKIFFAGLALASLSLYAVFKTLAKLQVQVSYAILASICTITLILGCVGFAVVSLYLRGQSDIKFADRLRRLKATLKRIMMIYAPIAIGLAFCAWAYIIGSKVYRISEDVRHLRIQAVRYVLPRELKGQLATELADSLKTQKPNGVTFEVAKDDEEAGSFASDLHKVFSQAGWPDPPEFSYSYEVPPGLAVEADGPGSEEVKMAFERVFDHAGVPISTGGTGGPAPPNGRLLVTIKIGHRRRDKFAVSPTHRLKLGERRPPGYPSDDDYVLP